MTETIDWETTKQQVERLAGIVMSVYPQDGLNPIGLSVSIYDYLKREQIRVRKGDLNDEAWHQLETRADQMCSLTLLEGRVMLRTRGLLSADNQLVAVWLGWQLQWWSSENPADPTEMKQHLYLSPNENLPELWHQLGRAELEADVQ